ncbi:GNAT family N-acetyltransferase [Fusibacter ferrireducens]|uniref:GNAT family N-acetyltransferase n=1 Tax=Fusibacter ferrireducens TaxID=2785058 RepID=A0ABR9ZT35_9FIRM|nr:GNAT family N-acetyltransferase [Fusibacter ferrireducens]MBF4693641.1 GNAT family N-acetyltransferase [Fusibacter ferrireducens]
MQLEQLLKQNPPQSMVFESHRIRLRALKKEDVNALYEMRHSLDHFNYVNQTTDAMPDETRDEKAYEEKAYEETKNFIDKILNGYEIYKWYFWGIELKATKALIGTLCLWNFNYDENKAEIGYELDKAYQNNGYVREGVKRVLNFAFKVLMLSTVEGIIHAQNRASVKVVEFYHFALTGILSDKKQIIYSLNRLSFLSNYPERAHEMGIKIGSLERGALNKITDVAGIRVGHATLQSGAVQTGVTIIIPSEEDMFAHKMIAASHVINGFGKTTGLIQIDELGTLETPIALTNTLAVGRVQDALVDYMIASSEAKIKSINPVVGECNDSYLNDITHKSVQAYQVLEAIKEANVDFSEGAVGAGRGMSCHQLKGGIGSSSRCFNIGEEQYTLGVLVLSNHGLLADLIVDHSEIGSRIDALKSVQANEQAVDKGSCMIIVAMDLPVSDRQLKRICKRAVNGLARLGSYIGHGSGEVVIGFSTANKMNLADKSKIKQYAFIDESQIDIAFRAVVEATEEAVLNSMLAAETVEGVNGHRRESLQSYIHLLAR